MSCPLSLSQRPFFFFFFNDPATTEIYTLSLHDALPIFAGDRRRGDRRKQHIAAGCIEASGQGIEQRHRARRFGRSEEHTSELQSQSNLVCRLLLEKKKKKKKKKKNKNTQKQKKQIQEYK